jgi:hypothetical protein
VGIQIVDTENLTWIAVEVAYRSHLNLPKDFLNLPVENEDFTVYVWRNRQEGGRISLHITHFGRSNQGSDGCEGMCPTWPPQRV